MKHVIRVGILAFSILAIFFVNMQAQAQPQNFTQTLCDTQGYKCIRIGYQSWETLFPDPAKRDMIQRLNRMNLPLRMGMMIAIPLNPNATSLDIAPFSHDISPQKDKTIIISLGEMAWGAYSPDGKLVKWGPISGGKDYCSDTNASCLTKKGVFYIYQKRGPDCFSRQFPVGAGGAPMPYCMFYSAGYAIHGTKWLPGYDDSHGCVRIFTEDAQWLNEDFTNGGDKTKVIVL